MLSIIIPTYNEAENIVPLVRRICKTMPKGIEIIIVDDNSPDGTGKIADRLAKRYPVRVVHRVGKRGFAPSVLEGFQNANGDILGLIDADQSHPPELLPVLLENIKNGADIVVASRRVGNGGVVGWNLYRRVLSWGAAMLAWPLASVKDKTAGYFLFRRDIIPFSKLILDGHMQKVMLEIVVKSGSKRVVEVPFTFINRQIGKSKTSMKEIRDYIRHLGRLYWFKVRNIF